MATALPVAPLLAMAHRGALLVVMAILVARLVVMALLVAPLMVLAHPVDIDTISVRVARIKSMPRRWALRRH